MCLVFFTTSHVFFQQTIFGGIFGRIRIEKFKVNAPKKHPATSGRVHTRNVLKKKLRGKHTSAVRLQTKIVKSKTPDAEKGFLKAVFFTDENKRHPQARQYLENG